MIRNDHFNNDSTFIEQRFERITHEQAKDDTIQHNHFLSIRSQLAPERTNQHYSSLFPNQFYEEKTTADTTPSEYIRSRANPTRSLLSLSRSQARWEEANRTPSAPACGSRIAERRRERRGPSESTSNSSTCCTAEEAARGSRILRADSCGECR